MLLIDSDDGGCWRLARDRGRVDVYRHGLGAGTDFVSRSDCERIQLAWCQVDYRRVTLRLHGSLKQEVIGACGRVLHVNRVV